MKGEYTYLMLLDHWVCWKAKPLLIDDWYDTEWNGARGLLGIPSKSYMWTLTESKSTVNTGRIGTSFTIRD